MQSDIQNSIKQGDCCKVLSEIAANSIHLTITSPPYGNAIDYEAHIEKNGYYRGRVIKNIREYIDEMVHIFNNLVYRVTKDGGYCCIVIGNELANGSIIPLPHMMLSKLVQPFGNWVLHEEFIWHKVTGGTNRYGSFVLNPFPKYFRANIMHEYIFVLRKGNVSSGRTSGREILPAKHEEFTKEIANSVWNIPPVPPGYIDHPCPFPEEIPCRLIELYSYEGEVILDPFNGSGQTTKAARNFARRYIGIDLMPEYVSLAKARLNESTHIRHYQLIAKWQKIPSHLF